MANSNQARKRIRQTARRTDTNRGRLSRIRTYIKKVETAIAGGDKATAEQAFRQAMPEIHRGVTSGLMHRNTAARKLSRLHRRISGLSA